MAVRRTKKTWLTSLDRWVSDLTDADPLSFSDMTPSKVPERAGVYLITAKLKRAEDPYYVGRSKNLQQRLYRNHLMGSFSNARLKKYLCTFGECADIAEAKQFIRDYCSARWIFEDDTRVRGAIEGYVTGRLFPKYGIYEEH